MTDIIFTLATVISDVIRTITDNVGVWAGIAAFIVLSSLAHSQK